jgi:predicted PurR-regulated permease PerM
MRSTAMSEGDWKSVFTSGDLLLFRYTAIVFAGLLLVGLVGVALWLLGAVLAYFYHLLLPLAIAGVLALVLAPVVDFLESRLRIPRLAGVLLLFVVFIVGLLALAFYVLPTAIEQARGFLAVIPDMVALWFDRLEARFPWLVSAAEDALTNGGGEEATPLVNWEALGERVRGYVALTVGLAFVPLFLFFALLAGDRLEVSARELLSVFSTETEQEVLLLGNLFVEYVTAFFRGQLVIALIMGALLAIGFTLIGLKAAILFGLVLGLLNIVPYLGAIISLVTVLPVAYMQPGGGLELVGWTLLVYGVVQTVESLLLTPKIMADRSGLHPAVVVISIFFWGTIFGGLIGMILAVPLSAFFATVWRHLRGRLRKTVVSDDAARDIEQLEERWLNVEGVNPAAERDRR